MVREERDYDDSVSTSVNSPLNPMYEMRVVSPPWAEGTKMVMDRTDEKRAGLLSQRHLDSIDVSPTTGRLRGNALDGIFTDVIALNDIEFLIWFSGGGIIKVQLVGVCELNPLNE